MEKFGFKPKHFSLKPWAALRPPTVQYDLDPNERHELISTISIRGWRLEMEILNNLNLCIAALNTVHTLRFGMVTLHNLKAVFCIAHTLLVFYIGNRVTSVK